MSDYNYGVNFLKQWFSSANRGSLTIADVLAKFTTAQIETFGKLARSIPTGKWSEVISLANKEYGAVTPSRAAFNSYFLTVGGTIDTLQVVKDGLSQSVDDAASVAKGVFTFGLPMILIGAVVILFVIPAMGKSKLKVA